MSVALALLSALLGLPSARRVRCARLESIDDVDVALDATESSRRQETEVQAPLERQRGSRPTSSLFNTTYQCGEYLARFGPYVDMVFTAETCPLAASSRSLRVRHFDALRSCGHKVKSYWGEQIAPAELPRDIREHQAQILEHLTDTATKATAEDATAYLSSRLKGNDPFKVPSDEFIVQLYTERSGATQVRAPTELDQGALDYFASGASAPASFAVVDYIELMSRALPDFRGDWVIDAVSHRAVRQWAPKTLQDNVIGNVRAVQGYHTEFCPVKVFFANPRPGDENNFLVLHGIETRCYEEVPHSGKAEYHTPDSKGWDYAKAMLMTNFLWLNHLVYHLAYEHLVAESISLQMYEHLSPEHWVFRLCSPLIADVGLINSIWGMNVVVSEISGVFPTQDEAKVKRIIDEGLQMYPGNDQFAFMQFLADPSKSGVGANTSFPFRDMGMKVWATWHNFVNVIVDRHFDVDDQALQKWWADKFFWEDGKVATLNKKEVTLALTNLLWLASFRHDYNHDLWITHPDILWHVPGRLFRCEWAWRCWPVSRRLHRGDGTVAAMMPGEEMLLIESAFSHALHGGVLETPLEAYHNPKYGFSQDAEVMEAYEIFLDGILGLMKKSKRERRTSGGNPYPVFASLGSLTH